MRKIRVAPSMDSFRLLVRAFASAGEAKRIRPLVAQVRAASDHTLPLPDLISAAVAALAGSSGSIGRGAGGSSSSSSSVVLAVEACILQLRPKAMAKAPRETTEAAQQISRYSVAEQGPASAPHIRSEGGSESEGMTGVEGVPISNVRQHQESSADPRDRRTAEVVRVAALCGDSSLMSNLLLAYAQAGMTSAVVCVINKHIGIEGAVNQGVGVGAESSSHFPGAKQSPGELQLGVVREENGESNILSRTACVAAAKVCADANLHDVLRRLEKYMMRNSLGRVAT